MDRHIQQTNDRLQCIKQVGVARAGSSALPRASTVCWREEWQAGNSRHIHLVTAWSACWHRPA